jgi:acyl-CoA thioesterase
VDSCTFLGLTQSHNPYRWSMPVTTGLCTFGRFMFGGCGLGASISALEGTAQRDCIWATAQYLSFAKPGEVLDIDVTVAAQGHQITQARAVCHVGQREILTVNAALGTRSGVPTGQWERMPQVPEPGACPTRPYRVPVAGTINERLEQRLVKGRRLDSLDGTPGDGQLTMWARIPAMIDGVDGTALAVLGDYVPMGVGQALGIRGGGTSLDNTLRVVNLVPTEWVLLDVRVHAVDRGFGHGLVHMFAEDGTLLATASQSCIVRFWQGEDQSGDEAASARSETT